VVDHIEKDKAPLKDKTEDKKPVDSKKDGKKKQAKMTVYYEIDSSTSPSPSSDKKIFLQAS
jgi:hypothetical protein